MKYREPRKRSLRFIDMLAMLMLLALAPQDADDEDRRPRRRALDAGLAPRFAIWQPNANGRFDADEGFSPFVDGTSVSLDHDLDIADDDAFPLFEFGLTEAFATPDGDIELERITVSFWSHEWEGSTRLDGTEIFNQRTFPAGADVDGRFRVGVFGIDGLTFAGGIPETGLHGGMTVGLRVIDVKATMTSAADDASERTRLLYFGVGFRGEWHPSPWVFGSAWCSAYFSYGAIDNEVIFDFEDWGGVDFEGAVTLGVDMMFFRLEGGFRFIANSFANTRDDEDASEENEFSFFAGGPFIAASVRF